MKMEINIYILVLLITVNYISCSTSSGWVKPKVIKGNKFFDSNNNNAAEFRIKGVGYMPRPNSGSMNVNSYDLFTDDLEDFWKHDIENFIKLGVNTVRIYAVDPTKSHDKFMCALSSNNIYVIVDMTAECKNCSVPKYAPPKCYPDELLTRMYQVYNAFAVYDNVLAFSVGNENNYDNGLTTTCVKALLRDVRAYANNCNNMLRKVPIGLVHADKLPRSQWISYYDCIVDSDTNTRAEWQGWNQYVECDPSTHLTYNDSAGLQELAADFQNMGYTRPVIFTEFGCNEIKDTVDGVQQMRAWRDAKWMNEEKPLIDLFAGGIAFEYSVEVANIDSAPYPYTTADKGRYGIGYFSPEHCDGVNVTCQYNPYPEFTNLSYSYNTTIASTVKYSTYTPNNDTALACGTKFSVELPSTPNVPKLQCSNTKPTCNGVKSTYNPGNGNKNGQGSGNGISAASVSTSSPNIILFLFMLSIVNYLYISNYL